MEIVTENVNVDDGWQEVMPDVYKFEKEGDTFTGKLISKRENVGPNDSMMYTFEVDSNKRFSIWGSAVLDSRMAMVSVGQMVRIEFKGTQKAKDGKGKPTKIFSVKVRE